VKPAKLRSIASVECRIKVLKQHLGNRPVSDLQEAEVLNWFKTESEYADDVPRWTLKTGH
jgi:hypothetical protein